MRKLAKGGVFLVFALAVAMAVPAVAQDDLWLHVRVEEGDGAKVVVNLPIGMVEKALAMVPEEHFRDGRIELDDTEWTVQDLRELWESVATSPDMTFVTVEDHGDKVRVWKENNYLMVTASEHHGEGDVNVKVPTVVVDALLSGDGEALNFRAAIEALAAEGEGELVTVTGEDERVRVWVDAMAEAR